MLRFVENLETDPAWNDDDRGPGDLRFRIGALALGTLASLNVTATVLILVALG